MTDSTENSWQQVADTGWKCWYQSRGIWGALVVIGASVAGIYGYEIKPDDQKQLVELLVSASTAAGGLVALIGRFQAKHRIGKPQ